MVVLHELGLILMELVLEARDSFNVSGMTDNSTGNYTVTYSANFNNANNSPVTGAGGSGYTDRLLTIDSITTSTVRMVENDNR
jgi:hypothetical protein